MSATATAGAASLTEKQRRILAYLREKGRMKTYFKSRLIGEELGMSAKEVGANMSAICDGEFDITVEKWGYSSGTTWKVTQ
jgi:DNA-binding MarR family transcriptional regulator